MNILHYQKTAQIRMAGSSDDPLFAVKDVCQILEIKDWSDIIQRLPKSEKGLVNHQTPERKK